MAPTVSTLATRNPQLNSLVQAFAGGCGGILSMLLLYPLNNVSTRLQVQQKTTGKKKSLIEEFGEIIQNEGVSGLYSGLSAALAGIAATNAIYYYWYSFFESFLRSMNNNKQLGMLGYTFIAADAGVITSVLTNPIWMINTRMQTRKGLANNGFFDHLSAICEEEGIQGLFRGVIPALILVSNPVLQFVLFEKLKQIIQQKYSNRSLTGLDFFLLGAVTKAFATVITYPYLVIKSRQQDKPREGAPVYRGTLDALIQIYQREGPSTFYKGMQPKLIQSVLTSAFLFMTKEKLVEVTWKLFSLLLKLQSRKVSAATKR
eukprot:TRINITY_DN9793_c0_g5_i1.p1 TRINITY_DN9793_c0_g5~~TRINITY_DN9793_c0_g5_i1.p1  ORF type:complete len:317 (+),score=71.50 TRINITY_DN9793_c0_g5_i1:149-1099(+)